MSSKFKLAHLSDLHLGPMPMFWPWHWNIKRALGFANWMIKRRYVHLPFLADILLDDIRQQGVDHTAVSGDLTNIGMPAEHRQSLAWLKRAGQPMDVSAVPGNHDIYCKLLFDRGPKRWAQYMSSQEYKEGSAVGRCTGSAEFPYVRRWGNIALIGLNSAVPTAIGKALGQVGDQQRRRLETILTELGEQRVCRVVMIHHPPLPGQAPPARALQDAALMQDVLTRAGAELVIHGHNHRAMLEYREWQGRPFPVVGVPSCSTAGTFSSPAAYNIYTFTRADERYKIELIQRQISRDGSSVQEVKREPLMPEV